MTTPTVDHGEILHLAGRLHLSPALDEGGAPAFSAAAGDGLRRCGWAGFFAAMEGRSLAVDGLGEGVRLVPAGSARGPAPGQDLAHALAHVRRFCAALRSSPPR